MKRIDKPAATKEIADIIKVGDKLKKNFVFFDGRTYHDDGFAIYEVTKLNRVTFHGKDVETGATFKFNMDDLWDMKLDTGRTDKVKIYEGLKEKF